jgi:citrate lyase subunit beta / citryl-CoA lyase
MPMHKDLTKDAPRARRASLFVPGSSPKMIARAATVAADEVVIDLEDSVSLDQKYQAREHTVAALRTLEFAAATVSVRINCVGTRECLHDLIALVRDDTMRLDALVLPKTERADQVHFIVHALDSLELDAGRTRPIGLVLQLESAAGLVGLAHSSQATRRLEALAFGPGDYAADLGVGGLVVGSSDPAFPGHQWAWAMSEISNHARAVGAQAIDGPYADVADEVAFRSSAAIAVALGFDGKHCIHPRQVPWAMEAFTPSPERVEEARRLLEAVAVAQAEGRGAALLDGRMIDEASRRLALRLLARADRLALAGP